MRPAGAPSRRNRRRAMTKRLTFGIILTMLLTMFGRPCYAPTDWVVNAMDYANGLVKDGSSVVEEYSSYANIDIQGKMGQMGDFNAAKKSADKVKKIKERADKGQQKLKKLKALRDKAQEKKAALEKSVKAAKDKADSLKAKYEEAKSKIDEAKDKINEAKDKIDQAKDKINEVKDKVDEVKDKVNEVKDKVDEVKDKVDEVKDKVDEVQGEEDADTSEENTEGEENADTSEEDTESRETEETDISASDNQPQLTPIGIKTKIDAAAAMQNLTTTDGAVTTEITLPIVETSQLMETSISAAEVQELAEDSDADIAAEEVSSEFNLEEQLLMSDQLKAKERAEKAAPLLSNEELRNRLKEGDIAKLESLRQSRRQSFGVKAAAKESTDE